MPTIIEKYPNPHPRKMLNNSFGVQYIIEYITMIKRYIVSLQWRHNERDGVSNHQRLDCLLNRLFRRRSNKTSNLHVTGLCEGNSPVTGVFPTQRASNAENISIWWCHHVVRGEVIPSVVCSPSLIRVTAWRSNYIHYKVQPLKFGNGLITSFHNLLGMWLLI